MNKDYLIFVPEKDIDEDFVGYSGVVEWSMKNLSHINVMVLSLNDVYLLQYHSDILDIISDEDDSFLLQEGENTWIIDNEVKLRIQKKLTENISKITDQRLKEIGKYLLNLLEISIVTNKSLYFIF